MVEWKDPMVKEAILIQLKGKVIGEGNKNSKMGFRFDVDDYTVRIFNKPGRKLMTCTCPNGCMHLNEPTICKHKIAGLMEWIKLSR